MGIIIKDGLIVDGTGAKPYKADVLIENENIIDIGKNIDEDGHEVINVRGKVVCPGFIDLHNHADLNIYHVNKAEPFVMQGITSVLTGLCGIGVCPTNDKLESYFADFASRAFCSSPTYFKDTALFFNSLEEKGISLNLGYLIPQGNVRACVMGTKTRPATVDEIEEMKKIVRNDMEAGAFGLSSGLVYPPGSVTPTEELIELSKIISEYDGIYDSHMRNEGAGLIDIGMSELIRIGKEADVRVHISHWSAISRYKYAEITEKAIQLANKARSEGLQLTADITTYDDGFTSLSFVLLPTWVYNDFKANLTNPRTRKQITNEIFDKLYSMYLADAPFTMKLIPKFLVRKKMIPALSKGVIIIYTLKNHEFIGKTLYEALTTLYPNKKIEEALLDYFLDEDGGIMIRIQQKNEENSMVPFFNQEFVSASSDAIIIRGGNTHPRTYNSFPHILNRWVKKKGYFSLEEVIRKITSLPASVMQLSDRGILKPEYKADIVVFDQNSLKDKGTLIDGCQYPEGIDHVIVNGKITVKDGKHLGVVNGRVLRHTKR